MSTANPNSFVHVVVPPGDRAEIYDALYRYGAGQDLADATLLESAFSEPASFDFVQPAKRLGVTLAVTQGRAAIIKAVMAATDHLDTTHVFTNLRVTSYDGDTAMLWALAEAQHLPVGNHARHLLLVNYYTARLVRSGSLWLIDHLAIENVWMTGESDVLFARKE